VCKLFHRDTGKLWTIYEQGGSLIRKRAKDKKAREAMKFYSDNVGSRY
jgi:hypothetical protein